MYNVMCACVSGVKCVNVLFEEAAKFPGKSEHIEEEGEEEGEREGEK